MQATLSKRFGSSVNFGVAYTWSKAMGTANTYSDFINPICSRCADYRRLDFDRTHIMVINYDWRLPGLRDAQWLLKAVTNGWQVTGITQFISGQPEDVKLVFPNINLNQRLGGTWTEALRASSPAIRIKSTDRNKAFNWEAHPVANRRRGVEAPGSSIRAIT